MSEDQRPTFTLGRALYCTRCEANGDSTDIAVQVLANTDETGAVYIIEVEEGGERCNLCDGVRTIKERPDSWTPEQRPTRRGTLATLADVAAFHDVKPREKTTAATSASVAKRKTKVSPRARVGCTECTWTGLARYLIDGRCPNDHGRVEIIATPDEKVKG